MTNSIQFEKVNLNFVFLYIKELSSYASSKMINRIVMNYMKTETRIKKQYDSEPEEVKEYMHGLIDQLVRDYGVIDPSWTVSLGMICDWYNVYVQARNDIKDTGVSFLSSRGDYRPHPSFSAMNTASSQIQKLLSTFAASPYQKSKMKSLDRQGAKIYDESEYINGILDN